MCVCVFVCECPRDSLTNYPPTAEEEEEEDKKARAVEAAGRWRVAGGGWKVGRQRMEQRKHIAAPAVLHNQLAAAKANVKKFARHVDREDRVGSDIARCQPTTSLATGHCHLLLPTCGHNF